MDGDWSKHDLTRLLQRAQKNDPVAEQRFCELVNAELRAAAGRLVRFQNQDRATSLVNEVFVRLFRKGVVDDLINRRFFFKVAIDQMRQILRERIRTRKSWRQGGRMERHGLDVVLDQYLDDFGSRNRLDFIALDDSLRRLRTGDRASLLQYEVITLHFLLGYQQKEIAELLELSQHQIARELKAGKAKLALELKGGRS